MNKELVFAIGEKTNKAVSILNNEQKVARDYGIGFLLNHAEVHLLGIINEHPDENTSQLAARLGITKGAIAQITKKLLEKGLMTSFHPPENKKEVYFEMTKLGKKAVSGHNRHHQRLNSGLMKYFETLSDKDMQTILTFLDNIIEGNNPAI
ncbi:MAG: MarR family transcriptional regulator [Spirochaetaceae bacterium]|jgi:DNA-binding MarR family transcriptional regulator|nr:MarR family transcriptional regulator [Spirochaetaceae bacterium]